MGRLAAVPTTHAIQKAGIPLMMPPRTDLPDPLEQLYSPLLPQNSWARAKCPQTKSSVLNSLARLSRGERKLSSPQRLRRKAETLGVAGTLGAALGVPVEARCWDWCSSRVRPHISRFAGHGDVRSSDRLDPTAIPLGRKARPPVAISAETYDVGRIIHIVWTICSSPILGTFVPLIKCRISTRIENAKSSNATPAKSDGVAKREGTLWTG